jgi:two-component system chemotaxis family response regulator WspR
LSEPSASIGRKPFRFSLQAKIVLLVLLCVGIPLFSIGIYGLRLNRELLQDKVHENLTNQLYRKATELDDWLKGRINDVKQWSASKSVFEGSEVLTGRAPGDAAQARGELNDYLARVMGFYRTYDSLFVADLDGRVIASTREERVEADVKRLLEPNISSEGVSRVFRSDWLGGRPTMVAYHPVVNRKGDVIAFVVARLDLDDLESHLDTPVDAETAFLSLDLNDAEKLNESIASSTEPPSFWLLNEGGGIVAEAGKVAGRPGERKFEGDLPTGAPLLGPVLERRIPGHSLSVYTVRRMEGPLPGFLVASMAKEVAYRSVEESKLRLLKWGVPGLLLILLLTALVARRALRPILLLSDGAKRVSLGEDVYLPASGNDEIAELTFAFNDMVTKVREGRQRLEEARDQLAQTNEGLRAANRTLETLAITDGLTGLYNHRHFQDTIDKEIRRCDRESRLLSLLLIDIDHFKQYNDRFGHTEGDAALRRVAGQIAAKIRSTDMAFRYGGEEMAVLLPSCGKEQATDVAEKIRVAVSTSTARTGRFGAKNTVSVGVATFPEDGRVARALVDTADAALYQAKAGGRDRVVQAGGPVQPDRKSDTAG